MLNGAFLNVAERRYYVAIFRRITPSTSDTWRHEKIQTKAHDHLGLA